MAIYLKGLNTFFGGVLFFIFEPIGAKKLVIFSKKLLPRLY